MQIETLSQSAALSVMDYRCSAGGARVERRARCRRPAHSAGAGFRHELAPQIAAMIEQGLSVMKRTMEG